MLPGQVSVLEVILEEEEISCFDNILSAVTKMSETKNLVQWVQTICKLSSCKSSAGRLKTWLRSRMPQAENK